MLLVGICFGMCYACGRDLVLKGSCLWSCFGFDCVMLVVVILF